MSFDVAAESYDRFMGKFSGPLAANFVDFAGIASAARVLDVGCGPGALTDELVRRVGAANVTAVDPSQPFVTAARTRQPDVDVRQAAAEQLPFADNTFDAALAQLVVHFMKDPVAGLREMARVTRSDGVVSACVWDHGGGEGPLSLFWDAVHHFDAGADDESDLAGSRKGHLGELFRDAGLRDVADGSVSVSVEHASFDQWWEPFTLGVGPAGAYVARLDTDGQERLRQRCRELLPDGSFTLTARAWSARGRVA